MSAFYSDRSLIDDARLQVDDQEVSFTVQVQPGEKDVYVMSTTDYARELAKTKYGNEHGQPR